MSLNSYNKIARFYDELAAIVFLGRIKKAQRYFLHEIKSESKVLILGGGTGWILEDLLNLKKDLQIDYVEASSEMIVRTHRKLRKFKNAKVKLIHGTHEEVVEQYDVILTPFFLDLFDEKTLEKVTGQLCNHLKANGQWIVTDFCPPKSVFKVLYGLMKWFFKITTRLSANQLLEFGDYLERNQLKEKRIEKFYNGFIFSSIYIK